MFILGGGEKKLGESLPILCPEAQCLFIFMTCPENEENEEEEEALIFAFSAWSDKSSLALFCYKLSSSCLLVQFPCFPVRQKSEIKQSRCEEEAEEKEGKGNDGRKSKAEEDKEKTGQDGKAHECHGVL